MLDLQALVFHGSFWSASDAYTVLCQSAICEAIGMDMSMDVRNKRNVVGILY